MYREDGAEEELLCGLFSERRFSLELQRREWSHCFLHCSVVSAIFPKLSLGRSISYWSVHICQEVYQCPAS